MELASDYPDCINVIIKQVEIYQQFKQLKILINNKKTYVCKWKSREVTKMKGVTGTVETLEFRVQVKMYRTTECRTRKW